MTENFFRRNRKKILAGAAVLGISGAAVESQWTHEESAQHTQHDAHTQVPHVKNVASAPEGAPDFEHAAPLSADDEERRREQEAFRDRMAEELSKHLPEGYSISMVTGVSDHDGARQVYDEFLKIQGPNGEDCGSVYPDEGDGGHLIWSPSDRDADLLSQYNVEVKPFELSAPDDLSLVLDDARTLQQAETANSAFHSKWDDNDDKFITAEDGSHQLNPEYVADQHHVSSMLSDLAVTHADEGDDDDE